jgi:hypothetical protein
MEWSSTSKGKWPGCQCEASCGNICPPCTLVIIRDSNLSIVLPPGIPSQWRCWTRSRQHLGVKAGLAIR